MPGNLPVIYYDSSDGKYFQSSASVNLTPLVKQMLEEYIGKENVVMK